MRRVYLDHNARVPLCVAAQQAMVDALKLHGNPSSPHAEGQAARAAVETARMQVAKLLAADEKAITFTGGATESLQLALQGALDATQKRTVVTAATEHHAVLDELDRLERHGVRVMKVAVDANGNVDEETWRKALSDDVAVAMLMWANNETGVIHNVRKLLKRAREDANAFTVLDAAQIPGRLEIEVGSMAADAVAISACKFGGPPGVGALWLNPSSEKRWKAPHAGGSQERAKRPGTENLIGIVGMGAAAQAVEISRVQLMRDAFEARLKAQFSDVIIHGEKAQRLPNTTFAAFPGVEAQTLLMLLDQAGIAASSGSACVSGSMKPSHVLLAMGVEKEIAKASVRFSFGAENRDDDVEAVIAALQHAVPRSRVTHG